MFVTLTGVNPRGRVAVATASQRLAGLDVRRFRETPGGHAAARLRTAAVRLLGTDNNIVKNKKKKPEKKGNRREMSVPETFFA